MMKSWIPNIVITNPHSDSSWGAGMNSLGGGNNERIHLLLASQVPAWGRCNVDVTKTIVWRDTGRFRMRAMEAGVGHQLGLGDGASDRFPPRIDSMVIYLCLCFWAFSAPQLLSSK